MINIRNATKLDHDSVREIHVCAFPENENEVVSKLAVNLLDEDTIPVTISLVAEVDGSLVGNIGFSPVSIHDNKEWNGYILAPLAVKPEYQKSRIGSALIKNGIEQLSNMDVNILFVYGDPKYYSKFGFRSELASNYTPPYTLEHPFGWLALTLKEDISIQSPVQITCVDSLNHSELW